MTSDFVSMLIKAFFDNLCLVYPVGYLLCAVMFIIAFSSNKWRYEQGNDETVDAIFIAVACLVWPFSLPFLLIVLVVRGFLSRF